MSNRLYILMYVYMFLRYRIIRDSLGIKQFLFCQKVKFNFQLKKLTYKKFLATKYYSSIIRYKF